MLLSIIIPAYNVDKYLEKCLQSVLNQESIDYEIIIINDGSTDLTLKIAKTFEKKYSNIIVIDQKNKGIAEARNIGIKNARGKYISFIDSDDYILPDLYKNIFTVLKEDFDIACFDFLRVNEGENIKLNNEKVKISTLNNEQAMKAYLSNEISSYLWDKIYNVKLFKENNIKFPANRLYEDLRTSYELMEKSNKIIKTNIKGYAYIQRDGSITKSIVEKNLNDFSEEYIKVLDSIESNYNIKSSKELIAYKVIKYNAIIRMKQKLKNQSYYIDERIKYKLSLKEILTNNKITIKEKIINIIGENNNMFYLLKELYSFVK